MKTANQRSIAFILLVSLFLQSCGVNVPSVPLEKENAVAVQHEPIPAGIAEPPSASDPQDVPAAGPSAVSSTHSPQEGTPERSATPTQPTLQAPSQEQLLLDDQIRESSFTALEELIEAFRDTQSEQHTEAAKVLYKWIEGHVDLFASKRIETLDQGLMREYTRIAGTPLTAEEYQSLLHKYFQGLAKKVRGYSRSKEAIIQALDDILWELEGAVFDGNASDLISVGNWLLDKTDPDMGKVKLDKSKYTNYARALNAPHNILLIVKEMNPQSWLSGDTGALYNRFQKIPEAIKNSTASYPYVYYSHLLSSSLKTVEASDSQPDDKVCLGTKVLVQCHDLGHKLIGGKDDIDTTVKAGRELVQIFQDLREDKDWLVDKLYGDKDPISWYERLSKLAEAGLHVWVLSDERAWGTFESQIEGIKKDSSMLQNALPEDRKAFQYGVINQLLMVILRSETEMKTKSLDQLNALTTLPLWSQDQDIMEAIFEGLLTICSRKSTENSQEQVSNTALTYLRAFATQVEAFQQQEERHNTGRTGGFIWRFQSRPEPTPVVQAMQKWMGQETLDNKLLRHTFTPNIYSDSEHRLFDEVKAVLLTELSQKHSSTLLPDDTDLSPIPLEIPDVSLDVDQRWLCGCFPKRLVKPTIIASSIALFIFSSALAIYLRERNGTIPDEVIREMLRSHYQQQDFRYTPALFINTTRVPVEIIDFDLRLNEQETVNAIQNPDQFAAHAERQQWLKTPIALTDLFSPTSLTKQINKVLLVGEAGVGKTSLTRKIAYDWSIGHWGQNFVAVYVLPVSKLKDADYAGQSYSGRTALATVIIRELLPEIMNTTGMSHQFWMDQINRQLTHNVTLVILDGIDEQFDFSQTVLQEAMLGKHKLLLTSRPYGIVTEKNLVDIEVESIGLDERHQDNFINYAVGNDTSNTAQALISFIENHQIEDTTSAPVNLNILCALWQHRGREINRWSAPVGLAKLYGELSNHVWYRFVTEEQIKVPQTKVYTQDHKEKLFQFLENTALTSLEKGKIIVDSSLLGGERDSDIYHIIDEKGFLLLKKIENKHIENKHFSHAYEFPHLTFHEYFAGRKLARQFVSEEKSDTIGFLQEHMYVPRYSNTLSFMAGVVLGNDTTVIQPLLQLVSTFPSEVLGLQYLMFQLRLLNQWLLVTDNTAVQRETMQALEGEFYLERNLSMWFSKGLDQYARDQEAAQVIQYTFLNLLSETSGLATYYSDMLLAHIQTSLNSSDPDARIAATQALTILVDQDADLVDMLDSVQAALEDRDIDVRIAAIKSLATLVEEGTSVDIVLPFIQNALQDSVPAIRIAALRALPTLVDKDAVVGDILFLITKSLQDSDWNVRISAIEALVALVDKDSVVEDILSHTRNALEDTNWHVRSAAIQVLPTLVDKGVVVEDTLPLVLNGLLDSNFDVQSVALAILVRLVDRGLDIAVVVSHILNMLQNQNIDPLVRSTALRTLPSLVERGANINDVLDPIYNALQDEKHAIARSTALKALVRLVDRGIGLSKALRHIQEFLDEDNLPSVRSAAIESRVILVDKGLDVEGALSSVQKVLESENSHLDVRIVAIKALVILVDKGLKLVEVLPLTQVTLRDRNPLIRSTTLQTLGALLERGAAVKDVLPPIMKALEDPDSNVRKTVIQALPTLLEKDADIDTTLTPILKELNNTGSDVHDTALEALKEVPTGSLIEFYWIKKDESVIPFLIPKLYEVALTIGDGPKTGQKKLTLHSKETKNKDTVMEWIKSDKEVAHFQQLVQNTDPFFE